MKNRIFIFLFSGISLIGNCKELLPTKILDKSEKDATLRVDEAVYKFSFHNINDNSNRRYMTFSVDGTQGEAALIGKEYLEFTLTPGKHIFQFYYNENYREVFTDSLMIRAQYRDSYSIYLEDAEMIYEVEKPVIYLYPEKPTELEVKMNIKGKNAFMYPAYNDSWKFTAHPNGDLAFGDKVYNYLFWEASQHTVLTSNQYGKGFLVEGKNAVSFLEEKLSIAGLTSKERADFITYWGPRLQQNAYNFVHFEFNERCNYYAELAINPQPETLYRIYMLWYPTDASQFFSEQEIVSCERKGFTVIEWGGQQINSTEPGL